MLIMMKNIWLDGMMGLIVGDALGCPVQFLSRADIKKRGPVTGMEGYGTYNMPEGTWTDDSSMALASLDSIINNNGINPEDTMRNFMKWEFDGDYTPFGEAFDEGNTCSSAIWDFRATGDYKTCGRTGEYANGNGALMRILPVCLYYINKAGETSEDGINIDDEALKGIHLASGLTHNHLRSQMACGLYYFMAKEIIRNPCSGQEDCLIKCLQKGLDEGFKTYGKDPANLKEMRHYDRLFHLDQFRKAPEEEILSTGYVVDSIEAAVWCLITTDSLKDCLLKAVNLGDDTDTVAAIAGGLAGLYYGYENIPQDWIAVIKEREYVEEMCCRAQRSLE